MPGDFDRRLLDLLRQARYHHVRDGRHPIWYSPITKRHFPVPTGIKSRHTANEILKQAGLPKALSDQGALSNCALSQEGISLARHKPPTTR